MVSPDKRGMKYKHKKTSSGTKKEYFIGKKKKHKCAITSKPLSGVPHDTRTRMKNKSKTQKRPSAPFGGVLLGNARRQVFVEFGKVEAGIKQIDDVDEKYRKYVKQVVKK